MDYLEIVKNEPGNPNGATIIFDKVGIAEKSDPTEPNALRKLADVLEVCKTCSALCSKAMIERWVMNDAVIALGREENTFEPGGKAMCITKSE